MDCMREETFGPTLPVMKVRDAAEAIEKANDSRFGLSGSVWTRDKVKAMALARQMSTGAVSINNVLTSVSQFPLPMAGWKESGIGSRSGGADGIRKYCRTKSIVAERIVMKKEPNWYPYSRTKGKIVSAAGRLLGARTGGADSVADLTEPVLTLCPEIDIRNSKVGVGGGAAIWRTSLTSGDTILTWAALGTVAVH
jgi:hypothetical protein